MGGQVAVKLLLLLLLFVVVVDDDDDDDGDNDNALFIKVDELLTALAATIKIEIKIERR
jgi:hypothetical protein